MQEQKKLNRRDFLRLSGVASAGVILAACGTAPIPEAAAPAAPAAGETAAPAAAAPAAAPAGGVKEVAREKTLILAFGGDGTQFTDTNLGNPYATGASHQIGSAALWEPLFFYSAYADESIPWLATGFEYNADFTELTVNIREGVEWSDGTPFTAKDVAFTLNMLIANAPLLSMSTEIKAWVKEAKAIDDLTAQITFFEPRPRFSFTHMSSKFDTGLKWVPEHIFKDVTEVAGYQGYDPEKGLPLATGPYKIVEWSTSQKFIDRRDDWWAVKTGFAELPAVERILMIPYTEDTRLVQMIVNNQIDSCLDLRANTIPLTVEGNPNVITHTGREMPMGYMDWWPTSMWFNCDEGPYADKNVRWAVSYSIDREQMLEVALGGSGILTQLPFPQYPPVQPYFDAAKPLLEKYNTTEFNLDKAAERMTAAGYTKDGEGFWVKDGERIQASIGGWQVFTDIGPVIAEQLRKAGFEADFATPADHGTRISDGTAKIWLNGHGGTIIDPFDTMDMYTSKYWAAAGDPTAYNSRFRNPEYDTVLGEMAKMKPDSADPAYMELYLKGIEIYLDNLVDAPIQQWLHRIPMNTTYWSNWPTAENSYVNGAFWHLTFPLMLYKMKPTA